MDNLASFSRLYGYVRFFHPSDEGASADWTRIAVNGARAVRLAPYSNSLADRLRTVFAPISVGLELRNSAFIENTRNSEGGGHSQFTHWQYSGLALDGTNRLQRRANSNATSGAREPFFESGVQPDEAISGRLGDETWFRIPIALPIDESEKTPSPKTRPGTTGDTPPAPYSLADPDVRVAGVIILWNVLQHFFPYWNEIGTDWPAQLPSFVRKALSAEATEAYYHVLSEMVAMTRDGHGYVFGQPSLGGLPILVERIEGRLLVTAARKESPIHKGDIILSIDGIESDDVLQQRLRITSGSDQLREYRALNQYGAGPIGSEVRWRVLRQNEEETVTFRLGKETRGYFSNGLSAYSHRAIYEPEPGIFYVNILSCPKSEFRRRLPEVQSAKAIIFDWRPIGDLSPEEDQIDVLTDVLPHLTSDELPAPPIYVSSIARPDGQHLKGRSVKWKVTPVAPRISGSVIFITVPGVVSYGETCTVLIVHHRLAHLVGDTTAGCNGGAAFIPLPGGPRVMWTQMKVTKHDGSRLYLDGYKPDYPVARTGASVLRGEDEYLLKAVEVAKQR